MTSTHPPLDLLDGLLHFAVGIEDTFIPQTRLGARSLDEYELTGHYDRWREDIDLAAATGAEAIRYGVPWYRVEPAPGRFVWDWLDGVVDRLVAHGLTPIVDLVHYGAPLWLDNGALNADYPERVAAYAYAVASRYVDRLSVYTPLNEPTVHADWCGETGTWPPYLTGPDGWVKIARSIARGLALTQQAVTAAIGDRAVFVHVEAGLRYDVSHADDAAAAGARFRSQRDLLIEDLVHGLVGPDHPLVDFLLRHGATTADLDWHRDHPAPADVMGVNFYPHLSTGVVTDGVDTAAPARGEAGADGLAEVLHRFHQRYGAPVMLTETSSRGDVSDHIAWLEESVRCIAQLRRDGLPVVGYTWFPLFDLLDWSYRDGLGPPRDYLEPLGLIRLVPDDVDRLQRVTTDAVEAFRKHALARGADSRLSTDLLKGLPR